MTPELVGAVVLLTLLIVATAVWSYREHAPHARYKRSR